MSALTDRWRAALALSRADRPASQGLRVALRAWAGSLDTLARGLGAERPDTVPAPPSWATTEELVSLEQLPGSVAEVEAWDRWWQTTRDALDLPPVAVLAGEEGGGGAVDSWTRLHTRARESGAPSAVVAHLSTERTRWESVRDALRRMDPGVVRSALESALSEAETTLRQWWTARLSRAWQRPSNQTQPGTTRPDPPPGPVAARPRRGIKAAEIALAALGVVVAIATTRRRRP